MMTARLLRDGRLLILIAGCGLLVAVAACSSGSRGVEDEEEVTEESGEVGAVDDGVGVLLYAEKATNIREDRSTDSKVVGRLTAGQKMRASYLRDNWFAIFDPNDADLKEDQSLGFVYAPLLKPVVESAWGVIKYASAGTNIRQNRSTTSTVVGKLAAGHQVKVDFLENNWYAVFEVNETVRDEGRALGYVFAPLLKDQPLP
jgi:uncharacterized protein YgiM (DUF1202 family)